MTKTKIIFLDIDGPMIPSYMYLIDAMCSFNRIFPQGPIAVLNRLCKETGAKIVFNTTHNSPWKDVPDIEVAIVNHSLNPDYLYTDDLKTYYPQYPRDLAVKDWLRRHPDVTDWVALDDVRFTEDERLIWIDPDAGLHLGHLNRAVELLGGNPVLVLM